MAAVALKKIGYDASNVSVGWCWVNLDAEDRVLWMLLTGKVWEILAYVTLPVLYILIKKHINRAVSILLLSAWVTDLLCDYILPCPKDFAAYLAATQAGIASRTAEMHPALGEAVHLTEQPAASSHSDLAQEGCKSLLET